MSKSIVLYAEDDLDDRELMAEAFNTYKETNPITIMRKIIAVMLVLLVGFLIFYTALPVINYGFIGFALRLIFNFNILAV